MPIGSRLVEALVQHAKSTGGKPIAYEDLLTLGRSMYPRDAALQRALDAKAELGELS